MMILACLHTTKSGISYVATFFLPCTVPLLFFLATCSGSENDGASRHGESAAQYQEGSTARKTKNTDSSQNEAVVQLARVTLQALQRASIDENVEYCGYIIEAEDGALKVAGPEKGTPIACKTPLVYKPNKLLSSFHTHGGYDPAAISEVPSSIDFDAVASEQVDAFIATPGGRFWQLQFKTGIARLVCGPTNCLFRDSSKKKEPDEVPQTLTRSDVLKMEQAQGATVRK